MVGSCIEEDYVRHGERRRTTKDSRQGEGKETESEGKGNNRSFTFVDWEFDETALRFEARIDGRDQDSRMGNGYSTG